MFVKTHAHSVQPEQSDWGYCIAPEAHSDTSREAVFELELHVGAEPESTALAWPPGRTLEKRAQLGLKRGKDCEGKPACPGMDMGHEVVGAVADFNFR